MAPARKLPPGKKHLHISVSLLPEQHAALYAIGQEEDRSVSAILRRLVEEDLARRRQRLVEAAS